MTKRPICVQRRPLTIEERIRLLYEPQGECWVLRKVAKTGYGAIVYDKKIWRTHRLSYFLRHGPIPEDLVIDHLCMNKACVNPDHLEAVTQLVNIQRYAATLTHCPNGHKYTDAELTTGGAGQRRCGVCSKQFRGRFNSRQVERYAADRKQRNLLYRTRQSLNKPSYKCKNGHTVVLKESRSRAASGCPTCCRERHAEEYRQRVRDIAAGKPVGEVRTFKRRECANGHPYVEGSFFDRPGIARVCKICFKASSKRYRDKKRQIPVAE